MSRFILIFLVLLLALAGSPSDPADLQKGFAAAQKGDFATALREWNPLAEQE